MTDTGVWRSRDHLVLRYYGSEHMMTEADAMALRGHLDAVLAGEAQSIGEDCAELREASKAQRAYEGNLLQQLGLLPAPKPLVRRI